MIKVNGRDITITNFPNGECLIPTEYLNSLDKDTYASAENKGAVKYADNLSVTMHTSPLQYYGTNNANEVGMHYFPINIDN